MEQIEIEEIVEQCFKLGDKVTATSYGRVIQGTIEGILPQEEGVVYYVVDRLSQEGWYSADQLEKC